MFGYIYTLDNTVDNNSQAGATNDGYIEHIAVQVTDGSNATVNGEIVVEISDDVPSLSYFTNGFISNEIGSVHGFSDLVAGADGLAGFNISAPALTGVVYHTVNNYSDGVFIGTTLTASTVTQDVFKLNVSTDGTYEFDLLQPHAAVDKTILDYHHDSALQDYT